MPNKLVITKYVVVVSLGAFLAAFFFLVDKTYSGIKSTQEKLLEPYKTKITNPELDTSYLTKLEQQTHFQASDLKPATSPTPTPTDSLVPTPSP